MRKQLKADLSLVLVTLAWGLSYYFMDICTAEISPFSLNFYRFGGAFSIAFLCARKKMKGVSRTTVKYSFLIGIPLAGVYTCATYGVMYTTVSNSGFLGSMSVVFTPILYALIKKKLPEKKLVLVVIASTIGIALLTLDSEFRFHTGDLLCLGNAFFYSIYLILGEYAVRRDDVDAFQFAVMQQGVMGIYMFMLALTTGGIGVPSTGMGWFATAFLAVACTGLALIVQTLAQQYTSATHVGVIYTLEPVFSGVAAYIFAHEVLLTRAYIGAALMIGSIIWMEVDFKGIKQEIKKRKDR